MSSLQQKGMKHAMKQENVAHSQEKLTELIPEEEQTSNLTEDFKSTILNMFKELNETRRMMYENIVSLKI